MEQRCVNCSEADPSGSHPEWFQTRRKDAFGRVYMNSSEGLQKTGIDSVVEISDRCGSVSVVFVRRSDGALAMQLPVYEVRIGRRSISVPAASGSAASELLRKCRFLRNVAEKACGDSRNGGEVYEIRRLNGRLEAVRVTAAVKEVCA